MGEDGLGDVEGYAAEEGSEEEEPFEVLEDWRRSVTCTGEGG